MNQTFRPPKFPLEVNNRYDINESFTKPAIKVQPELLEHTEVRNMIKKCGKLRLQTNSTDVFLLSEDCLQHASVVQSPRVQSASQWIITVCLFGSLFVSFFCQSRLDFVAVTMKDSANA